MKNNAAPSRRAARVVVGDNLRNPQSLQGPPVISRTNTSPSEPVGQHLTNALGGLRELEIRLSNLRERISPSQATASVQQKGPTSILDMAQEIGVLTSILYDRCSQLDALL